MDIVILGYTAHPCTRTILKECKRRGIPIKALVQKTRVNYPPEFVLQNLMSEGLTGRDLFRRVFNVDNFKWAVYNPGFALGFLKLLLGKRLRSEEKQVQPVRIFKSADVDFKGLTVKTVDDFNSKRAERLLQHLAPDLIILGPAAQIIKGNILRIPRIGTLNAHQGLLPKYRGMDVMEYSILNGDELGITIHFVDEGVDTGDIILRRYLRVSQGSTLEDLWEQAITLSMEALVDAIEMIESGNYHKEPQDKKDGKQFYSIHYTLNDIARSKLQRYAISRSLGHE